MRNACIAIHGGVLLSPDEHDAAYEHDIRESLTLSLNEGYAVLDNGGSSIDAVEKAVSVMEDSGLFDAGRGSVFTSDDTQELDASIMDGKTLRAGSVGCTNRLKNPIKAARLVMDKTKHVLLVGKEAEHALHALGAESVEPSYFWTKQSWEWHQSEKKKLKKHGTVGAVAIDSDGNLAAGTSTGGLEMKLSGRIGDSPIIGAGTYAENGVVAISCTGSGELFMRSVAAYDIAAQIKYGHISAQDAINKTLDGIKKMGGVGGIIAIDGEGNPHMLFNGAGMYRGVKREGVSQVQILFP